MNYSVFIEAAAIDDTFEQSPFRLVKDIKILKLTEDDLIRLAEELVNIVEHDLRGPSYNVIHKAKKNVKIFSAKVRYSVPGSGKGKSGSFRCVILVDKSKGYIFLLHVFSKKDKIDITPIERNILDLLVDEYAN